MTRWVTDCQSPSIYQICYCVREWRLSDRQMTLTLVLVLQLKFSNGVCVFEQPSVQPFDY